MLTIYSRIEENERETFVFTLVFLMFFAAVIYIIDLLFFKNTIVLIVLIAGGIVFSIGNFYYSTGYILRKNRALPLDRVANEQIYDLVENLCIASGLPVPKLYYTNDSAINAFTVGRSPEHAAMAFTRGALEDLDKTELEGVIAHELSHIENHDILFATSLAFLLGFIRSIVNLIKRVVNTLLSVFMKSGNGDIIVALVKFFVLLALYSFLIFLAVAVLILSVIPVIEELIFYRISREREFLADAEGALMTRYPRGLIGALEKIAEDERPVETANALTAHLYIATPFREKAEHFWSGFFHSHPSIGERIEILRNFDKYGEAGANASGTDEK